MTFDGGKVEPEVGMGAGEEYGAYVKLGEAGADAEPPTSSPAGKGRRVWWWMRMVLWSACLGLLAAVIGKWRLAKSQMAEGTGAQGLSFLQENVKDVEAGDFCNRDLDCSPLCPGCHNLRR